MRRMINSSVYDGPLTTPQDMFEERLNKRFDDIDKKFESILLELVRMNDMLFEIYHYRSLEMPEMYIGSRTSKLPRKKSKR